MTGQIKRDCPMTVTPVYFYVLMNWHCINYMGHSISNQRKIKRDPSRFLSNLVRSEYVKFGEVRVLIEYCSHTKFSAPSIKYSWTCGDLKVTILGKLGFL